MEAGCCCCSVAKPIARRRVAGRPKGSCGGCGRVPGFGRERQWAWFAMSVAHGARSRATQLRRAVCSGPATRVWASTRSPRSSTALSPREAPALSVARLSNDRALRLLDCWSVRRTLNCGARRTTAACRSLQRCALLPSGVPTSFQTVSVGAAAADAVACGCCDSVRRVRDQEWSPGGRERSATRTGGGGERWCWRPELLV